MTPLETQNDLSRSVLATWPGFLNRFSTQIEAYTAQCLELKPAPNIHGAWPSLPASTFLRAELLKPYADSAVLISDDIDGLGMLLSAEAQVCAIAHDDERHRWQEECISACGIKNYRSVEALPVDKSFDLFITTLHAPSAEKEFLEQAWAQLKPGGYWAIQLRSPWDASLYPHLKGDMLSVEKYYREVNHSLLTPFYVLDGGGDLIVYRKTSDAPLGFKSFVPGEDSPFYSFDDLDSLNPETLKHDGVQAFLDLLIEKYSGKKAFEHIVETKDGLSFSLGDAGGVGLSGQLNVAEEHLLLSFLPYSSRFEFCALSAAIEVFASKYTRVRSRRTNYFQDERIFG